MPVMDKFNRFNEKISFLIEMIGFLGLLLMMAITCIDVLGAKALKTPVPGALDIVMVSQAIAMAMAIAACLILDRHVEVEFFMPLLPRFVQIIIDAFVQILCLSLFAVISWQMIIYGYDMQTGNEVTPTIRVPLCIFAYLTAVGCMPVCLIYLQRLLTTIKRNEKR